MARGADGLSQNPDRFDGSRERFQHVRGSPRATITAITEDSTGAIRVGSST